MDDAYERVPSATQLALLPFAAAAWGYLRSHIDDDKLRLTIHRTMVRESLGYFQQACAYMGPRDQWKRQPGRIFELSSGIVGRAYKEKLIARTKRFDTVEQLKSDLRLDLLDQNSLQTTDDIPLSYLAIPFLGTSNQAVLILYADSWMLNAFADNQIVSDVCNMCVGLCELYDRLQETPFPKLRNFPLAAGTPALDKETVYLRLQEVIKSPAPPQFQRIASFNFEASTAG